MAGDDGAQGALNDFGCIADVYEELVDWAPYGRWMRELEGRLRRHGLRRGDWLLDAACGTGLSTIPWARRGYRVVGTDVSEAMLERARQRAREAGVSVELLRQELTDLRPGRTFDAAVCMHSGLDYLPDDEALRRTLRSLRGCLRAGGLLAFDKCLDVPSFYSEDRTETRRIKSGSAQFDYRWDRSRRLFEQRVAVDRKDGPPPRRTVVVYHLRATPPADLDGWCAEAGFEVLEPVRPFAALDPGMGILRAV